MVHFGSESSLYITFQRRVRTQWIENSVIFNFSLEILAWITNWQIKKINLEKQHNVDWKTLTITAQSLTAKGHKSKRHWVLYVIYFFRNKSDNPIVTFHDGESLLILDKTQMMRNDDFGFPKLCRAPNKLYNGSWKWA